MPMWTLRSDDRDTMMAGLLAAATALSAAGQTKTRFVVEVPEADAPDDAYSVTTEEGDPAEEVTRYYVPGSADHGWDLFMDGPRQIKAAVLASDGTVVTPAEMDNRFHARLNLRGVGSLLVVGNALVGAGVTVLENGEDAVAGMAGAPRTLAQAQAAALARLAGIYRSKRDAGKVIGGKRFASDREAVQDLSELVKRLTRVGGTQDFVTRAGDIHEDVDLATATAVYHAITDQYAVLQAAEATHAKAVKATSSVEAADALTFATGWGE